MLDERYLVEDRVLRARLGAGMVGAAALLQALERLPVAGRLAQRVAAGGDLRLVAAEVQLAGLAGLRDALQVGLVREQVVRADGLGRGRALGGESARQLLAHRPQAIGGARVPGQRPGELLLGEILTALAQGAKTLEREAERTHDLVGRPSPADLDPLDRCLKPRYLIWCGSGTAAPAGAHGA